MSEPVFIDTNVLVYANNANDLRKREQAQELLQRVITEGTAWISLQVLQEFFVVATRKLGMDAAAARRHVELYASLNVAKLDPADLLAAIDPHSAHGFSIWDALIVRAALISGCRRLYTEDLQPGRRIGALEVVNPFATTV